jgi:hypothetical protein
MFLVVLVTSHVVGSGSCFLMVVLATSAIFVVMILEDVASARPTVVKIVVPFLVCISGLGVAGAMVSGLESYSLVFPHFLGCGSEI